MEENLIARLENFLPIMLCMRSVLDKKKKVLFNLHVIKKKFVNKVVGF